MQSSEQEAKEDWNEPPYWKSFYARVDSELAFNPYPLTWNIQTILARDVNFILSALLWLKPWGVRTVLDVGCGISRESHVLAHAGFEVTGLDFNPMAIHWAQRLRPTEDELAQCIYPWEKSGDNTLTLESGARGEALARQSLRRYAAPGGSVRYCLGDFFNPPFPPGSFDVVYCRNGLRLATTQSWVRALKAWQPLLKPAGVLILFHNNALHVMRAAQYLLYSPECAHFQRLGMSPPPTIRHDKLGERESPPPTPDPSRRYAMDYWPTG